MPAGSQEPVQPVSFSQFLFEHSLTLADNMRAGVSIDPFSGADDMYTERPQLILACQRLSYASRAPSDDVHCAILELTVNCAHIRVDKHINSLPAVHGAAGLPRSLI